VISGAQIRAARGLLGISAAELADEIGISLRTLQRFEAVDGLPDARSRNLFQIKAALEKRGVTFLGDPSTEPGVQLQSSRKER
jgi:transcriptional regulator with XRE-family HTH domain